MTPTFILLLLSLAGSAVFIFLWIREHQTRLVTVARLQAERDAAVAAVADQRQTLAMTQAQLRDAFAALSRSALKENREDFLQNADLLLAPVRSTLDRVQKHLQDVDKAREGSFQAVASQLSGLQIAQEQLRDAAEGLSRSLGSPNVRGTWGEVQLRRIVELAGMLEQCDFIEKQAATSDAGARLTPDLIVKLPGNVTIVIDAKAPIDAYRTAANAQDETTREQGLTMHTRQVREHIRALGAKEYWKQFQPAPEFVVMFLPLEPLFQTAFERDGTLFDLAASLRVIPATPMTLLGLLKAVAAGWKQQQLAQNAEEIQQLGRELYDRLAKMAEHLQEVGANLQQAADSYNRMVGALEQKVLPSARRFKELGVSSVKDIVPVEPLRLALRPIAKPELTRRLDDADAGADDRSSAGEVTDVPTVRIAGR